MIKMNIDTTSVTKSFGIENQQETLKKLAEVSLQTAEVTPNVPQQIQLILDSDQLSLNEKLYGIFYAGMAVGDANSRGCDDPDCTSCSSPVEKIVQTLNGAGFKVNVTEIGNGIGIISASSEGDDDVLKEEIIH